MTDIHAVDDGEKGRIKATVLIGGELTPKDGDKLISAIQYRIDDKHEHGQGADWLAVAIDGPPAGLHLALSGALLRRVGAVLSAALPLSLGRMPARRGMISPDDEPVAGPVAENSTAEPNGGSGSLLDKARAVLEAKAPEQTDGIWLEELTARVAPHIRDWNISDCWRWSEWPDRDDVMPEGTPPVDVGIDLVARRRDDGKWVAIQAKARQLDEKGEGAPILSGEMNKFLSSAADKDIWAERWLVVNGNVHLGGHSPGKVAMSGAPVKQVNVAQAVEMQRAALAAATEVDPAADGGGRLLRLALACSEKLLIWR